jgi:hypothetical protein
MLTLIKKFNSRMEAEMAQNFLAENSIICVLQGEGASAYYPNFNVTELLVNESNAEKAKQLIELEFKNIFEK